MTKTTKPERTVVFHVNGHDQSEALQRLSILAARNNMPVVELRAALAEAGIASPETTEWTFVVPSTGKTIGAHLPDPAAEQATTKPHAASADTAKAAKLARVDEVSAKLQADRAAKEAAQPVGQPTKVTAARKSRRGPAAGSPPIDQAS